MSDDLHPSIAALTALGEMRVWSVVVTIFGDAVEPRGGVAPATTLQAILERLGIKPEAMRVALHRLVKDGWIARHRSGRQSYYGLTEQGGAEFLDARKRIYATAPALHDPWRLVIADTDAPGLIALAPGIYLGHAGSEVPEEALSVSGTVDGFPGWASAALAPDPVPADYAALDAALAQATTKCPDDPVDAAALRILIIHQWRRLLLRHPDLPAAYFGPGWTGEACRSRVLDLHRTLSLTADPWLDQAIGVTDGAVAAGGS